MFRRAILVTACLGAAGCSLFGGYSEFVIKIDSVTGPVTVPAGAPFQQLFWGPVGSNGCFYFKEFRVTRSSTGADVSVIGEEHHGGGDCATLIVYLRDEPLTLAPPVSNPFVLRVHQPDGTILTKTIQVQ
jgi:hypothetical protein